MTLWHLSRHTLAARYPHSLKWLPLARRSFQPWRAPTRRSSSNAAASEYQQDEPVSPSSMPSLMFRLNPTQPAVGNESKTVVSTARDRKDGNSSNAPRARRRRREGKSSVTANKQQTIPTAEQPGERSKPRSKAHSKQTLSSLRATPSARSPSTLRRLRQNLREDLGSSISQDGKIERKVRSSRLRNGRVDGAAGLLRLRKARVNSAMSAARERIRSGSTMKIKEVSIRSSSRPSSLLSSNWNKRMADLARPFFTKANPGEKTALREPTMLPAVYDWVEFTLMRLDGDASKFSLDTIPRASARGQQSVFMQISIWLLRYEPERMIDFLLATHSEPYPPINWIEDSLCHLGRCFASMGEDVQKTIVKEKLLALFEVLAHRSSGERLRFVDKFVRELLPHCTVDEVVRLYRTIKDYGVEVHGFTLLHLASRCAKDAQFAEASEALLHASDTGVDINRENYRSACSTVIRSCMSQPEGLRVCLDLVSQLVDLGLQLNGPICDIIMLNAVDAGDVNTAFAVYRSLVERGLQPRESTFAILLKGCKLNIDDADMLNGVIRDAISKVNVRQSVLVATEILHCLALHHTKHNPETALRTIAEAYAQLFDMTPLQQLGLPLPAIQQQRATAEDAMPPSPHALGFMISASIQRIQSYSERPDDIAAIYARWREHVEAGHPALAELAATDHTANIFLMAFIRTPSGLIHASRVVRDMQRDLPSPPPQRPTSPVIISPTAAETTPTAPITQAKPTVQTWSIFLHGFTRHGKTQLANQVLTYMRAKGIQPNEVTWGTLIMGHARAQDVEGTFEVIREAESEGYVWSRWTEDGVKWLRDRGRVAREMERRRVRREEMGVVDFSEELKGVLGEKLKGEDDGMWEVGEVEGVRSDEQEYHRYVPSPGFVDSAGEVAEQSRFS